MVTTAQLGRAEVNVVIPRTWQDATVVTLLHVGSARRTPPQVGVCLALGIQTQEIAKLTAVTGMQAIPILVRLPSVPVTCPPGPIVLVKIVARTMAGARRDCIVTKMAPA